METGLETKIARGPESSGLDGALDELMSTFETFREANDRRLEEIEKRMGADVVTTDKVERIGRALDELSLKMRRPPLARAEAEAEPRRTERKAAFEAYVRKGDASSILALEAKALVAGTDADGGYLVPDETESEIGKLLSEASPIRSIAGVRQVSSSSYKKPFATTGFQAGWVGETASRTQTTTPTLAELTFPAMELYAMPAATQTLLDDAAVDIDRWIAEEVQAAFAEQEGEAFVSGNGSSKPKGFLDYTKVADGSWAWGSIGYVATGAAGAFPEDDPSDVLVDLAYALKSGYRQNAHWVMNRKTQGAVRKFKDADGNYLWQPPASAQGRASLMGFPIAEAEDMPDIGANAHAIAFGDFKRGYLIVDRLGVRVLRDPYSAKPYVLFYTTKRVGGGVQNFEAIKLLKFAAS
ncbi:MAG: phage major capsid protein [Parvibaculaceae bacterium]